MALALWVALWGQPVAGPAPAGEEGRALAFLQEARQRRGLPRCREDRRLTLAARETSRVLLEAPDRPPDGAWTTFAARRLGVADPVVRPFAVRYARIEDAAARVAGAPAASDPAVSHCGVGLVSAAGARVLSLVTVRRAATIDPFPVEPAPGAIATLSGRLETGFARARVFVTRPDGRVDRVLMLPRARGFAALVAFDAEGEHRLEVMADGPAGPEPVALLSAYVGRPPPPRAVVVVQPDAPEDPAAVVRRLHELLDAARRQAGLPPLARDGVLARLARDHAIDMRQAGFFGHASPTRGNLADRMRAIGVSSPRVAENVARGPSAARIHANLMDSPAHRANVLDPLLTHVGLGVAQVAQGDVLAVMVFAADPETGMR